MARGSTSPPQAKAFFMATLVMWAVSVVFVIVFYKRYEMFPIVAGFVFFQSANWLIRNFVSRDALLVNTSASLLHASITSVAVIVILVSEYLITSDVTKMLEHSQLVGFAWPGAYTTLCISCGYFAYDQWDMLLYGLYSGLIPSILVHHLLILLCFIHALYNNVAINYAILALICELHSVFLHVRSVRRMAGFRDPKSKIVKLEWALNWVTFAVARFASHVLLTVKLIKDASKFGKGIEFPLALVGMVGLNFLNFFLGIDLFNAHRREGRKQNDLHSHQN